MRLGILACLSLCLGIAGYCGTTIPAPGQFNVECPARLLCANLEKHYHSCKQSYSSSACDSFVSTFRALTPKYDCQRSFDHTPTADYTVSAIWVCEEILGTRSKRAIEEEYVDLLRKLNSKAAKVLFASADFRGVLDGYLAEEYLDASMRAEKDLSLQGIVAKPTPIEALPTIGSALQVPSGAVAISFRGGTVHTYNFSVNGVAYFIDTRSEDNVVAGISTTDRKFHTREGIQVGDTWSKVKATGAKALIDESGNCHPQLPSGWRAVFDINGEKECDSLPLKSKVRQLNFEGKLQQ
jgi:hypothetical protein